MVCKASRQSRARMVGTMPDESDPLSCDAAMDAYASSVPDASPPDLAWALAVISRALTRRSVDAIADVPGGGRGYLVLSAISTGRPRSQLALAHQLGVDRTVMTYLLDDLEAAGLLERRADPADRRARRVLITARGEEQFVHYRQLAREAEDVTLGGLDVNDAATLRNLLDRVARGLSSSSAVPVSASATPA